MTIRELHDIIKRRLPDFGPGIGEIKQVIKDSAKAPKKVMYCLKENCVCHYELETWSLKEVAEFRDEISEKPRWMPDNFVTFLDAGRIDSIIKSKEALALSSFFMRHGLKKCAFAS